MNSISLSFGRLSCIESKSLQFAFEVQAKDTLAENASLEFKILPAVIHCFSCEKDLEVETYSAHLPETAAGKKYFNRRDGRIANFGNGCGLGIRIFYVYWISRKNHFD